MNRGYDDSREDKLKVVPSLHPGVTDLIRVLGKQAHCASRTLILCEPRLPITTKTNFHKNCSPKRPRSLESLSRYSTLWSPVQPETYYYDCFFYDTYPDREVDYQTIENKYRAIKEEEFDYSPPECGESPAQLLISPYDENNARKDGQWQKSFLKEHYRKDRDGTKRELPDGQIKNEQVQNERFSTRITFPGKSKDQSERPKMAKGQVRQVKPTGAEDGTVEGAGSQEEGELSRKKTKPNESKIRKGKNERQEEEKREVSGKQKKPITSRGSTTAEKEGRSDGQARLDARDKLLRGKYASGKNAPSKEKRKMDGQALEGDDGSVSTSTKSQKPKIGGKATDKDDYGVPIKGRKSKTGGNATDEDDHGVPAKDKDPKAGRKPVDDDDNGELMKRRKPKTGGKVSDEDNIGVPMKQRKPGASGKAANKDDGRATIKQRKRKTRGEATDDEDDDYGVKTQHKKPKTGREAADEEDYGMPTKHVNPKTGEKAADEDGVTTKQRKLKKGAKEEEAGDSRFPLQRSKDPKEGTKAADEEDDCVPCEDVGELANFQNLTSIDMKQTLESAENTTKVVKKSFIDIVKSLDPSLKIPAPKKLSAKLHKRGKAMQDLLAAANDHSCPAVKLIVESVERDQENALNRLLQLSGEANALNKLLERLDAAELSNTSNINKASGETKLKEQPVNIDAQELAASTSEKHLRVEGGFDDDTVPCDTINNLKNFKGTTYDDMDAILNVAEKLTNKLTGAILEIVRPHLPLDVTPESFLESIRDGITLEPDISVHKPESLAGGLGGSPCVAVGEMVDEATMDSKKIIRRLEFLKINSILLNKLLLALMEMVEGSEPEIPDLQSLQASEQSSDDDQKYAGFPQGLEPSPRQPVLKKKDVNSQQSSSSILTQDIGSGKSSSSSVLNRRGGPEQSSGSDEKSSSSIHFRDQKKSFAPLPPDVEDIIFDETSSSTQDQDDGTDDPSGSSIIDQDENGLPVTSTDESSSSDTETTSDSRPESRGKAEKRHETTSSSSTFTPSDSSTSLLEIQKLPPQPYKLSTKISGQSIGPNQMMMSVNNTQMSLLQLMEITSIIADTVIMEAVERLTKEGLYKPPTERIKSDDIAAPTLPPEANVVSNPSKPATSMKPAPTPKSTEPGPSVSGRRKAPESMDKKLGFEATKGSKAKPVDEAIAAGGPLTESDAVDAVRDSSASAQSGILRRSPAKESLFASTLEAILSEPSKVVSLPPPSGPQGGSPRSQTIYEKRRRSGSTSHSPKTSIVSNEERQPEQGRQKGKLAALIGKFEKEKLPQDLRSTTNLATPKKRAAQQEQKRTRGDSKDSRRKSSTKSTQSEDEQGQVKLASLIGKFENTICDKEDEIGTTNYEVDDTFLYYARITDKAFPPVKESFYAAGFMLKSAYNYTIPPRGKVIVKTDLRLELPPLSYGRLAPRKCLVENFGIDVGTDVIDRDHRDNVTVLLFNHSDKPFRVKRGSKVAQLICETIHYAAAKEVVDFP